MSSMEQSPITSEELQKLKEQYDDERPNPSNDMIMKYACGLLRSSQKENWNLAIWMYQGLFAKVPTLRRDCRYYLGVAYYKLGNYKEARRFADLILKEDSAHAPTQSLISMIDAKVQRDGIIGMAIAGSAIAAIGIVASYLYNRK